MKKIIKYHSYGQTFLDITWSFFDQFQKSKLDHGKTLIFFKYSCFNLNMGVAGAQGLTVSKLDQLYYNSVGVGTN